MPAKPPPPEPEAQRLTKVYSAYSADPRIAERQSLSNPGNRAIVADRWRVIAGLLGLLGSPPLMARKILDVGTGGGGELARLIDLGANPRLCHGIDLIEGRIAEARRRLPSVDFRVADGTELGFDDGEFDLVFLSTVVSSILDHDVRRSISREANRVLRRGGCVLWYDSRYPSPSNPNVRPVSRRELQRMFPGFVHTVKSVTLLPPLARRLGPTTGILYPALSAVPFLRSHLVGVLVKQ